IAELERETIKERTVLGRDRVAREGKFINGPVPFGYEVDENGFLVPSNRVIDALGISDCDLVRELFRRVVGGETAAKLTRWLVAAGVPSTKRYYSRKTREEKERRDSESWTHARICRTINNPLYKGTHTIKSSNGPIERIVQPLVTLELWERAGCQL